MRFLKKLGKDASRAYNFRRVTSVFLFRELSVRIQNCNYDFVMNVARPTTTSMPSVRVDSWKIGTWGSSACRRRRKQLQ